MSWSLPKRTWLLAGVVSASSICLLAFHATSSADSTRTEPRAPAPVTYGPVWVPEVVTAPGLPVQCADGTWTRTVVRGGCWRHGGVAY